MKENAILIDLDGTLANVDKRRGEFLKNKNWDLFYSKINEDSLNVWCNEIIEKFKGPYKIIIVTGRKDSYKKVTLDWLIKYDIHYDDIYFRKADDFRKDSIVKKEIFQENIINNYDILFVVDDRASVVEMWRSIGLVCLQCDEGNF